MVTEEDIKEYFDEDEWNAMSSKEKARLVKLTFKIDVFSPDASFEYCALSDDNENNSIFNESSSEYEDDRVDFLYCENCKVQYDGYCTQCSMVSQILDVDVSFGIIDRPSKTLPKNILEIKSSQFSFTGVFALKVIPEEVIFGPFDALDIKGYKSGCAFNVKGSKLFSFEKEKHTNWMRHINNARHVLEQNLKAFQHDGNLYFQSIKQINKGEELLVFYDGSNSDTFYKAAVNIEKKLVYACISCCLGFSHEKYLLHHQNKCPNNVKTVMSKKIVHCPTCQLFMCGGEFLGGHKSTCEERHKQRLTLFRDRPRTSNVYLKLKCTKCPFVTDSSILYKRHLEAHKSSAQKDKKSTREKEKKKKRYICETCGKESKDSSTHAHHKRIHKEKPFKCDTCGQRFRIKSTLKCHEMLHTGETRFHCADCDYKCIYREDFQKHVKRVHLNTAKVYKCSKCDYETYYGKNLKDHELRHEGIRNFKCNLCEKTFIRKSDLKNHELVHTNVRRFTCSQCEKCFKSGEALKTHTFYRHSDKNFKCEFCTYKTAVKEIYDRHLAKYHPDGEVDMKHKCERCKYQTNDRGNFNKHMNTHNGYRPFVCTICDHRFADKKTLKIHVLGHGAEKEFECAKCSKKFLTKNNLKNHMSVHGAEKKYKCSRCNYECNQQINLHTHIRSKHKSGENK